jgi:RimJ/RimL family protein N-acetyltransferase
MIHTDRLLLREWTDADREAFAELSRDPAVMEFLYPGPMSREESDAVVDRIQAHFQLRGFGFWALEIPSVTSFAGLVGLAVPRFEASFTPCVEVGWRLAPRYWGRGYAVEAAAAAMSHGFQRLGLEEIVAMTVPANVRSRRVMEKLEMMRDPRDDFEHPLLPAGHPLRRHVLYRRRRPCPYIAFGSS